MKLKGINTFEQHVEKLVLAGASAALLVVVAMQFTTQPNLVEPDSKSGKLPPQRAFDPAKRQADLLLGQLDSGAVTLPESPTLTLREDFHAGSAKPLIESSAAVALGVPAKIVGGAATPTADGKYAAVEVPAPTAPIAAVFEGAIDPATVAQYPELKQNELVPQAQPYDKASVSVEATFSGTALKAALEADPDGPSGELGPIPMGWWRDSVEILGTQIERSELLPTGEWSESTTLSALPGRLDLVGELAEAKRLNVLLVRNAADTARMYASDVQRPPFLPYLVGEEWIAPSDAVRRQELEEQQVKIDRVTEQVVELNDRIAALTTEMNNAPERIERQPTTQDDGGGGGKGIGGGGGRAPDPRTSGPKPKPPQTKAQVKRQLDAVTRERDLRQAELVALGGAAPTTGAASKPNTISTTGRNVPTRNSTLDQESLKVWGHDITAARGATYRYRLRVVINNPFYGNALAIPEEQREMAANPTVASAWTEWTEPVTLDPQRSYFITSAGTPDAIGGNRASAAIYEFYYGYWRVGSTSLTPGDPLEARLRLPAPELMPIFDETQIAAVPVQRPGFTNPEERDDGGGGGGKRGGFVETEVVQAPSEAQKAELPPNSLPGPKERSVAIDAVYLTTADLPVAAEAGAFGTGGGDRQQVFLRDGSGAVVARLPHIDRTSDSYRRMERSAKLGERQGVPEPKAEPVKPKPPPERQELDREGGGGGGGG
jgi:hypothetical protein